MIEIFAGPIGHGHASLGRKNLSCDDDILRQSFFGRSS